MVKKCPGCGNDVYYMEEDEELICNNCGTISSVKGGIISQIGFVKYKFKDTDYEYVHTFESHKEVKDFVKYVNENKEEYEYCKVSIYFDNELVEMPLV